MTSKNKKPFLSAAMIVKNEEHNIRRCLESLKGVCDEIIVVDTGSTDRTPEIVKEYTDKLYFHEWQGSFSEARNNSLKYPTGDWVLIIDADEELSEDTRLNLKKSLAVLPKNVKTVLLPTKSYMDVNFKKYEIATMPRVFRNGTIQYKNLVHNQPIYERDVRPLNLEMIHYGYIWTRSLREKKYIRMTSMIEKHLKLVDNPPEEIYYLCQLYKSENIGNRVEKLLDLGLKIIEKLNNKYDFETPIVYEFLFMFSLKMINMGYLEKGREIAEFGLKRISVFPDLYIPLINYYNLKDNPEEVLNYSKKFMKAYKNAIKSPEKLPLSVSALNYLQLIYFIISLTYLKLNDLDQFKINIRKAISLKVLISPSKFIQDIIKKLSTFDAEITTELREEIIDLHKFCLKNNLNINWDLLIENLYVQKATLNYLLETNSDFHNMVSERIMDPSKDYFEKVLLGKQEPHEFVNKFGHLSLILYYEFIRERYSNQKVIEILTEMSLFLENNISKGILLSFIGDCYLKKGDFKAVIDCYKQALDYYPDLRQFIKPILEDLSITLESDIKGVFDELKAFFLAKRELIFDFTRYLQPQIVERLYMLTDFYQGIYASAVNQINPEKGLELLTRIESYSDRLPFYYYHKAILEFKLGFFKEAEISVKKSLTENPWLADIKNKGASPYAGYYFEKKNEILDENDLIIWLGNISVKENLYSVINPLKKWRMNDKGVVYSELIPNSDALDAYRYNLMRYGIKNDKINLYLLKKILPYFTNTAITAYGIDNDDEIGYLLNEHSIVLDDNALNLLVFSGSEEKETIDYYFNERDYDKGVLVFQFPVNKTHENPLWYKPLNVCYRSPSYLEKYFEQKGYNTKLDIQENHNILYFKKGESFGN